MKKQKLILISFFFLLFNINHLLSSDQNYLLISGKPKITINKKKFFAKVNDMIFIPKNTIHRVENLFNFPVQIAEVQLGSILKETDIIRYKDIYGRIR